MERINILKQEIIEIVKSIESKIQELTWKDPIFGFITKKYTRCGKENCKCAKSIKYQHGPYYYLREEPEYKYAKYLGKKVPETIRGRIEIGVRIRELEKKHKKLHQSIKKLS